MARSKLLFTPHKSSPVTRSFFVFLATYFVAKFICEGAFAQLLRVLGAPPAAVTDLLSGNELTLQSIALFLALYAQDRMVPRRHVTFAGFLKRLLPNQPLFPESRLNIGMNFFTRGFLVASATVAASLFLGFHRMERAHWDVSFVWELLPVLSGQLFSLLAWYLLLDRAIVFLWSALTAKGRNPAFDGRFVVLSFTSYLLFQVFNDSPHLMNQVFTALICGLVAGGYLLWIEAGPALHRGLVRAELMRRTAVAGFLITLAHVYGQPVGGSRAVSVVSLVEGPVQAPVGSLASIGITGQILVVLSLVILVNVLLRRVLALRAK